MVLVINILFTSNKISKNLKPSYCFITNLNFGTKWRWIKNKVKFILCITNLMIVNFLTSSQKKTPMTGLSLKSKLS